MPEVTQMLQAIAAGDAGVAEQLLPVVYDELRRLAAQRLAEERPGNTLQPTALVHEAYLRLTGGDDPRPWDGRAHFFAAAAEAMRRILIDNARRKKRLKRGGDRQRVDLDEVAGAASAPGDDLLDLDEALEQFAQEEPIKAQLVKLRFYAGLSVEEAAECLGVSRATADRYWSYARAWLYDRLRK
jgi:RNA polymerase sigma factor (TIGR02999 family)